jgi:hypothetical protein
LKVITANERNGVSGSQLVETIGAVQESPELAKIEFRPKNKLLKRK